MDKSVLVNKDNKVKENFLKKINLVNVQKNSEIEFKLEEETYENYLKLKEHLKSQNIDINITKAYTESIKDYNEELITGLSLEIDKELDKNTLKEYGFIIRYPKGKEEITGYNYNPFYIRYVGKIIAKLISEKYETLEEYKEKFSGIIIVNKEKNMTSFDVVNEISHLFGIKKVGHTGTLDPLAEGVLIVCLGKATKIVELLTAKDKEYIAGVRLGVMTDTYDIEGKVLEEYEVKENLDIEGALNFFKKTYFQEVPIYSAVKVAGKKLYDYARNNLKVELPKKEVTIKNIELLSKNNENFTFKAEVTKGCYIRSLINDIGKYLQTGAVMTSLIRTKQGNISIEDAYTLEDIRNGNYKIYDIEETLDYPIVVVDKNLEFKVSNGVFIKNIWNIEDKVIFKNKDDVLLGIYEKDQDKLKTWKNFI